MFFPRPKMEQQQKFARQRVHIRCTVEWAGGKFRGRIEKISPGGASITDVDFHPHKGDRVQVNFEVRETAARVRLPSQVLHTRWWKPSGSFGVSFDEPPEEVSLKLGPILGA